MSNPFGGEPRDTQNLFGQPSTSFGQAFSTPPQTAFGVQPAKTVPSTDGASSGTSTNLFASATASSGTGLFGKTSTSTGNFAFGGANLFSQGKSEANSNSAATTPNLFAQFSASSAGNTSTSSAFTGGSVFGGAKLFSSSSTSAKGSKSTPAASLFTADPSFTASKGATSAESLESGLNKDNVQKTLFSNPVSSERQGIFGATSTSGPSSVKSAGLFGKESQPPPYDSKLFQGKKDHEESEKKSIFPVQVSETDTTALSSAQGGEKVLFGKPQKETGETISPRRRPFIKRDREQTGSAARSIFSKAVSSATGQPDIAKEIQDELQSGESSSGRNLARKTPQKSSQRRLSRMLSTGEEISSKIALVCKDVPASINNVMQLRKHFNKFGNVTKVFPSPAKRCATVHFKTHDDAVNAKRKGRVVQRGRPPLQLFWSAHSPSTASATQSKSGRIGSGARSSVGARGRSEVDDELASMAGTADTDTTSSYQTLKRPSEVKPQELSPVKRSAARETRRAGRAVSPSPVTSSENVSKSTSSTVTKASIESLMTPAKNSLDMYLLLESRDKIMKQGRTKQSDLKTAKAVQGTCPDMCYEKERYDREAKRRLSIFEIVLGTENVAGQNPKVDHIRAVKEYSRSSADQEEPLPHEMRPGPVLEMTMNYLLTEIADRGEESMWMDWYDFLWNRTRGIRKDITQQMLCDKTAVALIEKCARFHIYCAERLCEEDFHIFDQKINTENLTKSLQSLKELYSDLALKQQVFCETEAEFRAYMVLLNLNEGDTLREVQQLREEVRASREINFALQVYSALNSNNYVRFFKLAKKATFLCGCIMHRYFLQVRGSALKTMLRAFSIGGRPAQYPLMEVVRVLAFENTEEAAEFCSHYGLSLKGEEVNLDRQAYIEPEVGLTPRRPVSLIESKLMVAVGEVVNGSPLAPLMLPPPQISFDDKGCYTGEIPQVDVGSKEAEKKVSSAAVPSVVQEAVEEPPLPVKPAKSAVPNEIVKEIARQLFLEIIDEFSHEISSHCYGAIHSYLENTSSEIWSSVYQEVASPIIKSVCETELETQMQQKQKEMAIAARIVQREKDARAEMEIMIDEVVLQEVEEISTAEVRAIDAKLKEEQIVRCSESMCEELLEDVVSSTIQDVAEDIYQVDVVQRQQELSELEECVQIYRMSKLWTVWKKMYSFRLRLKRSMLSFPSAPSTDHVTDQVDILIPGRKYDTPHQGTVYINDKAKLQVLGPLVADEKQRHFDARVTLHHLVQRLKYHIAWSPINLAPLIGKQLSHSVQSVSHSKVKSRNSTVYWKLVISLPDIDGRDGSESPFCPWLKAKFAKGPVPSLDEESSSVETLSLYTTPLGSPQQQSVPQLATCVKVIHGSLSEAEVEEMKGNYCLLGSSALILVLCPTEGATEDFWQVSHQRLVNVLHAKPLNPSLPLVLVLVDGTESMPSEEVCDRLNIQGFIDDGFLSAVKLIRVESAVFGRDVLLQSITNQVEEGIRWLSKHYPIPPSLTSKPMLSLVEDTLSSKFYDPVFRNLKERKAEGHLHQPPSVLIELYNSVIGYLQEIVTFSQLTDSSWPVSEFIQSHKDLPEANWNSVSHMEYLDELFEDLKLPDIELLDMESPSWEQGCDDVWTYVKSVDDPTVTRPEYTHYLSQIRWLLKKTEEEFEDTCWLVEGNAACEPTYVNIPWTDIIMAAVDYKLNTSKSSPDDETEDLLMVHYKMPDVKFDPPLSWKTAQSCRSTSAGTSLKSTMSFASEKRKLEKSERRDEPEAKKSRLTADLPPLEMGCGYRQETVPPEISCLDQTIAKAKQESKDFEDFLKKALQPDTQVHVNRLGEDHMDFVPHLQDTLQHSDRMLGGPAENKSYRETVALGSGVYVDSCSSYPATLTQRLVSLEQDIASEKSASNLFEMKLRWALDR